MLHQIIYSSKATSPMTSADLEKILHDARTGNEARGISGALVYVDRIFFQILEGEREAVRSVVESIRADSRHSEMKVFRESDVDERIFPDWRMAYLTASAGEMAAWAGLEGSESVETLLARVQEDSARVPGILVHILQALASRSERPGS